MVENSIFAGSCPGHQKTQGNETRYTQRISTKGFTGIQHVEIFELVQKLRLHEYCHFPLIYTLFIHLFKFQLDEIKTIFINGIFSKNEFEVVKC